MDLVHIVIGGPIVVDTPSSSAPSSPVEANSSCSELFGEVGVGEGETEVAEVDEAHDPSPFRGHVLLTSFGEGNRRWEVECLEEAACTTLHP